MTEHTIHNGNLAELDFRIDALNRRAERNNIAGRFGYTLLRTYLEERENGTAERYAVIELTAPTLEIGGWEFLASIEIEEGGTILRVAPDKETPAGFERPDAHRCDYCGQSRYRTKSYLVRETATGDIKQVGKSCLTIFLGFELNGLWILETMTPEEIEEMRSIPKPDRWGNTPTEFEVRNLIALGLAHSSNGRAFKTRAYARAAECTSTADDVMTTILFTPGRYSDINAEQAQIKAEAEAVSPELIDEILAEAEHMDPESDYGQNCRAAAASTHLTSRNVGVLVSLIAAWAKRTEREAVRAARTPLERGFLGEERDKLDGIEAVIVGWRIIEHNYGSTHLLTFRTEDNHSVKWFASREPHFQVGDRVRIKGTVKAQDTYEGTDSTVLTRCTLTAIETADMLPTA